MLSNTSKIKCRPYET